MKYRFAISRCRICAQVSPEVAFPPFVTVPFKALIAGLEELEFVKCDIPGAHGEWRFEIDEKGVYQVYDSSESACLLSFSLSVLCVGGKVLN